MRWKSESLHRAFLINLFPVLRRREVGYICIYSHFLLGLLSSFCDQQPQRVQKPGGKGGRRTHRGHSQFHEKFLLAHGTVEEFDLAILWGDDEQHPLRSCVKWKRCARHPGVSSGMGNDSFTSWPERGLFSTVFRVRSSRAWRCTL